MDTAETWYYLQQGVTMGPLSRPAIEAMVRGGTLARDTLVWPGYGEWIAASSSSLGPVFGGAGGAVPPPMPMPMPLPIPKASKDWLPKDRGMRTAILVLVVIIGIIAMIDGIKNIKEGTGGGGGGEASINFQGCRGVSTSAVQCAYQNTGTVDRKLCMDVVVMCNDGRHVASACSDKMKPGESSTKLVDNFSPVIPATVSCSGVTYENLKAKG